MLLQSEPVPNRHFDIKEKQVLVLNYMILP